VTAEGGQLVVAGKRDSGDGRSEAERAFLHRGIAARGFVRTFVLAEGMEVTAATLEHGLLHIDLARPSPERLVRKIPIRSAG
jgi:HSP20 family molecular chaperone IbpA